MFLSLSLALSFSFRCSITEEEHRKKRLAWISNWKDKITGAVPLLRPVGTVDLIELYERYAGKMALESNHGGRDDQHSTKTNSNNNDDTHADFEKQSGRGDALATSNDQNFSAFDDEEAAVPSPPSVAPPALPPSVSPPPAARSSVPTSSSTSSKRDRPQNGLRLSREVTNLYLPFMREGAPSSSSSSTAIEQKAKRSRSYKQRPVPLPAPAPVVPSTRPGLHSSRTIISQEKSINENDAPKKPSVAPPALLSSLSGQKRPSLGQSRCVEIREPRLDQLYVLRADGNLEMQDAITNVSNLEAVGFVVVAVRRCNDLTHVTLMSLLLERMDRCSRCSTAEGFPPRRRL